ncbi:MAG: hypothetical protein IPK19_26910 [Chloroflexi bacterium]|nr:hypothetical protein [Chloroflexota bacterium]
MQRLMLRHTARLRPSWTAEVKKGGAHTQTTTSVETGKLVVSASSERADRTLMGHSWGGTFALYALFMGGELFRRFVVVSPDLPMGDGYIEKCERDYAARHTRLPANLYLAYAEYELNDWHLPHIRPFMESLQSRRYSGLRFFYQTFSQCRHCGVIAPAFQSGLWNVFELPVLI